MIIMNNFQFYLLQFRSLCRVGGTSAKEAVRMIMSTLMTDSLANQLSLKGQRRQGKSKLSILNYSGVVSVVFGELSTVVF